MAKNSTPDVQAPEIYRNPIYRQSIEDLYGLGTSLTNFDFTGNLSPLADVISTSPEVSRLALQYAQASLMPEFNRQRQSTINELANLGALESSTTANALSQMDENLAYQLQAITSQAALEDRTRALNAIPQLFTTGLQTLQTSGGMAGQEQQLENQLLQTQFENQLALESMKSSSGGLFGGLLGAGGGALAGLALAPITGGSSLLMAGLGGLTGGLAGGFGSSNLGGQLLSTGAGLYGAGLGTSSIGNIGQTTAAAGATSGAGRTLLDRLKPSTSTFGGYALGF